MENNPIISVIVPVYNVEQYLCRCVDSLLAQSYQNIEVILVDDGSPDGCPAICDEYAQKDNRVKVIHKKNGGLSSARNAGLDSAPKGNYVTFLDSDDWLEHDTYEYCVGLLSSNEADAIQFAIAMVSDEYTPLKQPKEKIEYYYNKDVLQYYMYSTTAADGYSVCRCLFAKDSIENERFRVGKINEDVDFKYRVLRNCKSFIVSNQYKYYYWQSDSSISTGGLKKKDFELYEAAEELVRLTKDEDYGTIAKLGRVKLARTPLSLLCKIAYFGIADKTIDKNKTIKQLTSELRGNLGLLLHSPLRRSRKILAVLFAINYQLANMCVKIAK